MNWFNDPLDEKLKQQLRKSQTDFKLDQTGIKNHLMQSVEAYKQKPAITLPVRSRFPFWAHSLAIVVLFISSATLVFADSSKPGDSLFFLDKLQEKAVLTLPLPSEQKANIQANIVNERVHELQKLKTTPNKNEVKARAIEESELSVTKALESITEVKTKLEDRGKTKQAERINKVLIKLDGLAEKNEEEIEDIRNNWKEAKQQEKNIERADRSLKEIQRARLKLNINSDRSDNDSGNRDRNERSRSDRRDSEKNDRD